jgi:hypothetical protein
MEYDEIDQYIDQLFREKDPSASEDLLYALWISRDARLRSNEENWKEYNSQAQIYTQSSLRGLTCAEWILIAAIGVGLLLFMMIKA